MILLAAHTVRIVAHSGSTEGGPNCGGSLLVEPPSKYISTYSDNLPKKESNKMNLPRIKNYGKYSSDNYGAHTLCVDLGGITM